jgi:hypothetical protein
MTDELYIGASKSIEIDTILQDACLRLAQLGIPAVKADLVAMRIQAGSEPRRAQGVLDNKFYLELSFKNAPSHIGIVQYETEIVPGYSLIMDPFTICVSVWVGADAVHRALTASVAAAIAAHVGGKILDYDHKWSDSDLSHVDEFMEKVREKYVS